MSKDHRSAGLRWLLLLRGSSFDGHGSFLGLFSSSFVFLMISCHIWSYGRWFCGGVYRDRWVMKRTNPLPAIMVLGDPYFSLGRSFSFTLWALHWGRKEEREHHVRGGGGVLFPFLFFPFLFWTDLGNGFPSLLDCSGGPHPIAVDMYLSLNGLACVLGLIDGPMSLLFVLSRGRLLGRRRLLGFVCLGPSKQSLMLWA